MALLRFLLLALALSLAAPAAALAGTADKPVRVAVYRGPASCDHCATAARRAIEKTDARYQVDFVGPDEPIDISDASLARYDVYVQPGGGQDIPGALDSLGQARVDAIRRFVARGGRYLGLCMGAYLADASNLGLIAQDLDSEVGRPGFPVKTIEDAAVAVRWAGAQDSVFFQDGPYLRPQPGDARFHAIATYENGDLAAARYSFERGLVVLSGPHPEAAKSWFVDAGIPLDEMPERDLFKDLLDQLDL